jgi:hypothetical protein
VYVVPQDFSGTGINFPELCYAFNLSTANTMLRLAFDNTTHAVGAAWEEVITTGMPQAFLVPRATVYVPKLRVLYSHGPIVMRNISNDPYAQACAYTNLFVPSNASTAIVPVRLDVTYVYYLDTHEWQSIVWPPNTPGLPSNGDVSGYGAAGHTHVLEPSGTGIIVVAGWTCLDITNSSQAFIYRFDLGALKWRSLPNIAAPDYAMEPSDQRFFSSGSIFLRPSSDPFSVLGYDLVVFGGIDWLRRLAGVVCDVLNGTTLTWSESQSCDYSTGPTFRYDALSISPHVFDVDGTTGLMAGGIINSIAWASVSDM